MRIEEVRNIVDGIPHMGFEQARVITDFILEHRLKNILELGFCHGVSTCYMAGAVEELGEGRITTIDLTKVRDHEPNIEMLLGRVGLKDKVTIFYEPRSYTWRLMKMLEESLEPRFDFCYIDGAHNWFVDGFTFFLVDKLLVKGGWIMFDDIDWTYALSPTLKDTENVKNMSQDEREEPQVRKVYELLVKTHPDYGDFMVRDGWGYAHKISSGSSGVQREIQKEVVYEKAQVGLGAGLLRVAKNIIYRSKS